MPLVQVCSAVQMLPQAPQLFGSVASLVQAPLQFVSVPGHVAAQAPAWQSGIATGQALAQVPQLLGSVWRLTQVPEHTLWPVAQLMPPDDELPLEELELLELETEPLELELELEPLDELPEEDELELLEELLPEEEDEELEVELELLPELLDLLPLLELELEVLELLLELELLELELLLELEVVPELEPLPVLALEVEVPDPTAVDPQAASDTAQMAMSCSFTDMASPWAETNRIPLQLVQTSITRGRRADQFLARGRIDSNVRNASQRTAMASISTRAPLGSAATCTVARAGGLLGKLLP